MRGRTAAAGAALLLLILAVPARAGVQPYGTNDAGGFRNVLPPGSAGTVNATQLAEFEAFGRRPRNWDDQQELYEGLLYASPTLTHAQIGTYFKDATFGVKPGDLVSTESPRPGVTIQRDRWGVPRIYGDTRADVMFGAGYAGASDRLFLMDILRHTGRAQLSSFIGGEAGNRDMDRTQWEIAPYTEADLQRQIDLAPRLYGSLGTQLVRDLGSFIDGINAYIARTRVNPSKLPAEYIALGKTPEPWKGTDVIAEASLIGGIFGKGGGSEVNSALLLKSLRARFGRKRGNRAWRDFRAKDDPETYNTVLKKRFPYQKTSAFSKRGLAIPDRGSVRFTPPAKPLGSAALRGKSIGAGLMRSLSRPAHASNWLLLSPRASATGRSLAVMGPQVGYYVPQVLMEQELHGPGIEARGATFPGVNLMVQLGHGRDYAWSATTSDVDNVDTFAEVLCRGDFHYRWKGRCLPMEKLVRNNSWEPNLVDDTPAGAETLTAYRTVHGIVYARGRVKGRKVAFARARTTYLHEADSAIGLFRLNDPNWIKGPESFRKAIDDINFGFNWAYVDAENIAYQLSGWLPRRAPKTSPDFPILGTGKYDWRGYNPNLRTLRTVPLDRRPHVVNQKYLVSWNGKQARGFAAADDNYSYGPLQRGQLIARRIIRALRNGGKMRLEQLIRAMEEPATEDLRAVKLLPILTKAVGNPKDQRLKSALALLNGWRARGSHRRDLGKDGRYDDDAAVTLMDAWWPKLVQAEFGSALGSNSMGRLRTMMSTGDNGVGRGSPAPPDFFGGWWGYVSKDLRNVFGTKKQRKRIKGRFSRRYCGGGSRRKCRAALRQSLRDALGVTRQQLYGRGECASDAQALCFDKNRFTVASAIDVPDFPFQNRPTFQQTVELTRRLPR